jgi:hypothetical protein
MRSFVTGKTINKQVQLNNRLTTFTNPPMKIGNLYVEKNETVFGDLDICGNLTVGNNIKVYPWNFCFA